MSLTNPLVSNFNFKQLSQVPNKTISDKFILHIFADHNRLLPATHHGEMCDYQSSVWSSYSHYIIISSSFKDTFLPSSLHNTSTRQSFHQLYYRRCLIIFLNWINSFLSSSNDMESISFTVIQSSFLPVYYTIKCSHLHFK